MNTPVLIKKPFDKKLLLNTATIFGYVGVAAAIIFLWSVREQNLIRAADGIGYWLGIAGSTLMLILLIYPLRKRIRLLKNLGSVKIWFQTHMLFGVLGPLLVLFHSNFNLGSLNGRIALFCTLTVASSGLIGRYLYAKFHYGMHGQRATLRSLQTDISKLSEQSTSLFSFVSSINERLKPFEEKVFRQSDKVLQSVAGVFSAPFIVLKLRWELGRYLKSEIQAAALESEVIADNRERLLVTSQQYLRRRLDTSLKFSQLSGCERLFSLWHIVHYPLFLVMVFAAIVHIFAVHAY